jgi:cysteinyl-tRNA synthetase
MIEKYGGAVTRLVILNAHYRQPVNYTDETVNAAIQEVNKMQIAYKQMALQLQVNNINLDEGKPVYIEKFLESLADDLNTANALAELYNLIKEANQTIRSREIDFAKLNNQFKTLTDMFNVLGLNIEYVKLGDEERALYNDYLAAKQEKNFAKSDEIRQILISKGIM